MHDLSGQVFFISGGARRIGAAIVQNLHASGANIILHYRKSQDEAQAIAHKLNAVRADSVYLVQADLGDVLRLQQQLQEACSHFGRLDGLINNASSFYPTVFSEATENDWDVLFNSNLKGAYFLIQAALPWLQKTRGSVINMTDIFAQKALKNFSLYAAAKAGLVNLTQNLALELSPEIRVNAVAPGAILWAEHESLSPQDVQKKLAKVPLQKKGELADIITAIRYLLSASYVTGQILAVDGGRSLT